MPQPKARALAPTDTTEATGMYRSLDKLKAKAAQSFRYPSSSGAACVGLFECIAFKKLIFCLS
jgi:hypothetical protein